MADKVAIFLDVENLSGRKALIPLLFNTYTKAELTKLLDQVKSIST